MTFLVWASYVLKNQKNVSLFENKSEYVQSTPELVHCRCLVQQRHLESFDPLWYRFDTVLFIR